MVSPPALRHAIRACLRGHREHARERRSRVAVRDGYSHLVRILKLVLPLAALVLMSMVFLLSRSIDPEQAVALAPVDVDALVREPRISDARFAGVTEDGAALTVLAESARADPDHGLRLTLSGLTGSIEAVRGQRTEFRAREGVLDQPAGALVMEGEVGFRADPGYDLRMDILHAALDRTEVRGWGGVEGDGPAGRVTAREIALLAPEDGADGFVLVFSGDVRLIYHPGN